MPRGASSPFPLLGITFYCFVLAVIATLVDYGFGVGNQVELLPGILRAMDPTYLANDFFVNTTDEFGPRIAYFKIVGFFGSLIGIEAASFLLLLLSNLGAIYVTYRVAEKLFPAVRLAPAVAALFACTSALRHGMLGGVAKLSNSTLVPEDLARPLCFLAVLLCLNRRYGLASLALLGASLFHPLVAALFALVAFAASAFAEIRASDRQPWLPLVWLAAVGAVIYGVWIRPLERSLSDQQFFEIVAYFRLPHHHLPSEFDRLDYLLLPFALLAGFLSFLSWKRKVHWSRETTWIATALGSMLALFGLSVLFVEVWPNRTVLSAQLFRLSLMLHWLVILCVSFVVGRELNVLRPSRSLRWNLPLFFLPGPPAPIGYALGVFLRPIVNPPTVLKISYLALTFPLFVRGTQHDLPQAVRTGLALVVLTAVFVLIPVRVSKGWLVAVVAGLFALLPLSSVDNLPRQFAQIVPQFTPTSDAYFDIAQHAKSTLDDAVFIVPPDAGSFRYLANRAIVVDYKAFPFQDEAMAEWYQRMKDVYGPSLILRNYDAAMRDMKARYAQISDERLNDLAAKYGATHAVLDGSTKTKLPILFEGKSHKVVKLAPSP